MALVSFASQKSFKDLAREVELSPAEIFDRPESWQERGRCTELPSRKIDALFFPERGHSSKAAKALCAECCVKAECLEYALERKEAFGVWGGTSERDRRKIRKEHSRASVWLS
jgi:WhiB family transcriptional regulator, redox-sensing transcriptional regulator